MKAASISVLCACALMTATAAFAQPPAATADKPVADAWAVIEDEQLWIVMDKIMDDETHQKLSKAAQVRLELDDDGGERFMDCIRNLSAHPDYTAAKVKVAFVVCSKAMAPARE